MSTAVFGMSDLLTLFANLTGDEYRGNSTGVLPAQGIYAEIQKGNIAAATEIDISQIQPASLDLRLGDAAFCVSSSFLPGPDATVQERLDRLAWDKVDLTDGAIQIGRAHV